MPADLLGEGARIILWQIADGTYTPGAAFPGPAALEYQLQLPAQAVRHAIRSLLECGVLRPGSPLTVAHPHRWRIRMPVPDVDADRVAKYILGRIKSGAYPGGTPLPPVGELTTLFRASRPAVQDALRLLAAREIVTGYPPRVGRPLAPPRRLTHILARETLFEERGTAQRQQRREAALLELQALLAASGLPDRESMSRTDAVTQWLRTQIETGTYKPGNRLPTGPALAAALGVKCHIVDAARKRLADEGLLSTDGNRGTRVCAPSQPAPPRGPGGADVNESVTRQAERRIRELLATYGPGERLPSHRALAKSLGVAHSTIRVALQPLRGDGLVQAHGSHGYFTTAAPNNPGPAVDRAASTGRPDPARPVHGPAADHHA